MLCEPRTNKTVECDCSIEVSISKKTMMIGPTYGRITIVCREIYFRDSKSH